MTSIPPTVRNKILPSRSFLRYLLNNPSKLLLLPVILRVRPYTMLPFAALCQAYDLVHEINRKKVPGSIVEMGCWKGGAGAMMAYADARSGSARTVWLFDSFEGLPEPTIEDQGKAQKKGWRIRAKTETELRPMGFLKADSADVETIMKRLDLQANVRIIKGWFQNTVPVHREKMGVIAVLRIDADLYESTKYCLASLYDLVSAGGAIILDDFDAFEGSRKALYEFFHERNISPRLRADPFGGRMYFKK